MNKDNKDKLHSMVKEMGCDLHEITDNGKLIIRVISGELKEYQVFETDTTIGIKSYFGRIIIERFK